MGRLIKHGEDGLTAEDEVAFQTQLEGMLRSPLSLRRLGIHAGQKVADTFSWDKHLDCYEMLFDNLLSARSGAAVFSK